MHLQPAKHRKRAVCGLLGPRQVEEAGIGRALRIRTKEIRLSISTATHSKHRFEYGVVMITGYGVRNRVAALYSKVNPAAVYQSAID